MFHWTITLEFKENRLIIQIKWTVKVHLPKHSNSMHWISSLWCIKKLSMNWSLFIHVRLFRNYLLRTRHVRLIRSTVFILNTLTTFFLSLFFLFLSAKRKNVPRKLRIPIIFSHVSTFIDFKNLINVFWSEINCKHMEIEFFFY